MPTLAHTAQLRQGAIGSSNKKICAEEGTRKAEKLLVREGGKEGKSSDRAEDW